ncbi:MAG: PAS domain S-box protein [Bacteroidales bacterium]
MFVVIQILNFSTFTQIHLLQSIIILCISSLLALYFYKSSGLLLYSENKSYSELQYKILFNNTTDAVFLTDLKGNFVEVNNTACKILGYTQMEFMNMNLNNIRSPKLWSSLPKILERIVNNEEVVYESEHITKQGIVIPVEMKSKLIEIQGYTLIIWTSRNISDRKELQKQVLNAVIETEERERERFAKDLHDGLGPLLSTIKLYINELSSEDTTQDEQADLIKYCNELIDEAVKNTRTISNNLTPHLINKYGMVKAIEAFISKIDIVHKISITFEKINIENEFERPIELTFFRIVTELINNTLKHAKANTITIILEEVNNKLILSYKDDGIGFDPDEALTRSPEGIGLKNIISRVQSIDGSCNFYNNEVQGTYIKIIVPLKNE